MALPMTENDRDREGVPPTIQELVQTHRDATGHSLHTLEQRSGDDHPVHFSYWHKILTGKIKAFPTNPETFTGIARALGTTELAVVLGFARQFGVPIRTPAFASQVPSAVDTIPPEEQRAWLTLLRERAVGETRTRNPAPVVTDEEIAARGLLPGRPATARVKHRDHC